MFFRCVLCECKQKHRCHTNSTSTARIERVFSWCAATLHIAHSRWRLRLANDWPQSCGIASGVEEVEVLFFFNSWFGLCFMHLPQFLLLLRRERVRFLFIYFACLVSPSIKLIELLVYGVLNGIANTACLNWAGKTRSALDFTR